MSTRIGLADIAAIGGRMLASSADSIAAVTAFVQRTTGVAVTVLAETTADGRYVFRGIERAVEAPVGTDDAIPYDWSLCSRIHLGESPATVPDTREVPALWRQWLRLKEGLGVDWDVLAFCTREVLLPDGVRFGTLCVHHTEPRAFSADEQALLEVLARLVGEEVARERAAAELAGSLRALAAAERRRVELAEELRHELRAPLHVIDGYAEAMLDGVVAASDEHLVLVRREAGRAMRLLDDLAELTRLEASPVVDETGEPVQLDALVLEMRDRMAPLAEANGLALEADVRAALVHAPRRRLEQVVVNLVRNALRALAQGGGTRITLVVRPDGDRVELGAEDDGPGIPPGEIERVFERFYRGSSAREQGSGTGLGLTIARRIVEAAGGEIAAETLEPRGARVVARLPRLDAEPVARGEHPGVQAP
ncbi:MAG: HAMP domain-containing sensor histidine kinase [Thermoleophilia bacterium]